MRTYQGAAEVKLLVMTYVGEEDKGNIVKLKPKLLTLSSLHTKFKAAFTGYLVPYLSVPRGWTKPAMGTEPPPTAYDMCNAFSLLLQETRGTDRRFTGHTCVSGFRCGRASFKALRFTLLLLT